MSAGQPNSLGEDRLANPTFFNRRSFLKGSAALTAGLSTLVGTLSLPEVSRASDSNLNLLGPRPGYGPQLGSFISALTWMREANGVIAATKGLTKDDLDYLIDPKANSIGPAVTVSRASKRACSITQSLATNRPPKGHFAITSPGRTRRSRPSVRRRAR